MYRQFRWRKHGNLRAFRRVPGFPGRLWSDLKIAKARSRLGIRKTQSGNLWKALFFVVEPTRPRAFSLAFDEAFFSPFWHEKMRKWVKPAKIYKCEKRATCGALLSTATATHLQRPRNEAREAHEARAGARGARAGVAIVADLTNDKISIEKNTLQNFSTVFTGGLIRSLGGRTHPQRVAHHQSSHPTPESEHLHAHLGTAREDLRHAVLRQEPEGFTKTPKFENGKGRKHGNSPCDVS